MPTTTIDSPPPQDNPVVHPSSLYQVDYHDSFDDEEDNKYRALRLDFADTSSSSPAAAASPSSSIPPPNNTIAAANNQTNEETSRLVPATCAICLIPYAPGCYVSWSSNNQCTHAFHRDCILMWLLKKEEPLCPCCRGEFVLESILNQNQEEVEENDNGGGSGAGAAMAQVVAYGGGGAIAAGGGEATTSLPSSPPSEASTNNRDTNQRSVTTNQIPPLAWVPSSSASSHVVRHSNLPGSFSISIGGVNVGGTANNDVGDENNATTPSSSRPATTSASRVDSFSINV
mmetsp:Transcript_20918/g.44123  ORF Transcript_20918/g.44123 Transcript_20918/m.44123 type:complete len:287 (+) Transcript_20918:525-1385(+)